MYPPCKIQIKRVATLNTILINKTLPFLPFSSLFDKKKIPKKGLPCWESSSRGDRLSQKIPLQLSLAKPQGEIVS